MSHFALDRPGLVFFALALAIALWAVVDTPRFLRLLSLNRNVTFTHRQLLVIRVPGIIVIFGSCLMILSTLLHP